MKKMMTWAACLLTFVACANTNDDKVIRVNELPQNAQTFIEQHFSGKQIALVKLDNGLLDKTYEVIFTDKHEVEFNKNGDWKEVNCKHSEVPAAIIPEFIREDIAKQYPQAKVWKIERDEKEYEVELSNGVDRKYPLENTTPVQISELPQAAQDFIAQHFAGREMSLIQIDRDFLETTYDVVFSNGDKLEFDKNGEWKEVDCKYSEVPAAIIPQAIRENISNQYPQAKILEIDRDTREYDVKLDNRLELKYNKNFQLIDID